MRNDEDGGMLKRIAGLCRSMRPYELKACDPDLVRRTRELMLVLREDASASQG